MATIEQFKQIRASVAPELQTELYGLLVQDLDAAIEKMMAIGAENNVSFSAEEVKSYLRELDEEDELVLGRGSSAGSTYESPVTKGSDNPGRGSQ